MTKLKALILADLRNIARDRFMVFVLLYVVVIAVALRLTMPWLGRTLAVYDIVLSAYAPLLTSFVAVSVGAQLSGMLFGFLLLEGKEDRTLQAMMVTPLPLTHYILYRIAAPYLLALLLIPLVVLIMGVGAPTLPQLLAISAVGALFAPCVTLFLASQGNNKVEAMALMKMVSTLAAITAGSWFVAEPLQWLFGVFPLYWVMKSYWLAAQGGAWLLPLLLGAVGLLLLNGLLLRRFLRRALARS